MTTLSLEDAVRLRLVLMRLGRRIRQSATGELTPSQLSVLATIVTHGPLTLGDVAAHERVQPPSITRTVKALERLGLVARTSASDRRVTMVELTLVGEATMDEIRSARTQWLAEQLSTLGPQEVSRLSKALPILEQLLGESE